jgi:hypothetical protein
LAACFVWRRKLSDASTSEGVGRPVVSLFVKCLALIANGCMGLFRCNDDMKFPVKKLSSMLSVPKRSKNVCFRSRVQLYLIMHAEEVQLVLLLCSAPHPIYQKIIALPVVII